MKTVQSVSPLFHPLEENAMTEGTLDSEIASSSELVSINILPAPEMTGKAESDKKSSAQTSETRIETSDLIHRRLLEGFDQGEIFHKTWFNRTPSQIKDSLKKLTKFCIVACSRAHCRDREIANNCHLMCPDSTTRNCPDPLQQNASGDLAASGTVKDSIKSCEDNTIVDITETPLVIDEQPITKKTVVIKEKPVVKKPFAVSGKVVLQKKRYSPKKKLLKTIIYKKKKTG